MPETRSARNFRRLLNLVHRMTTELPSDDDLADARQAIDGVISLLSQVRAQLDAVPSESERAKAREAMTVIEELVNSDKSRAILSGALGGAKRKGSRKGTGVAAAAKQERAQEAITELRALPIQEIRNRLFATNAYTLDELRQMASALRIRAERGNGREDLADRIYKLGFANPRGYQMLGAPAAK